MQYMFLALLFFAILYTLFYYNNQVQGKYLSLQKQQVVSFLCIAVAIFLIFLQKTEQVFSIFEWIPLLSGKILSFSINNKLVMNKIFAIIFFYIFLLTNIKSEVKRKSNLSTFAPIFFLLLFNVDSIMNYSVLVVGLYFLYFSDLNHTLLKNYLKYTIFDIISLFGIVFISLLWMNTDGVAYFNQLTPMISDIYIISIILILIMLFLISKNDIENVNMIGSDFVFYITAMTLVLHANDTGIISTTNSSILGQGLTALSGLIFLVAIFSDNIIKKANYLLKSICIFACSIGLQSSSTTVLLLALMLSLSYVIFIKVFLYELLLNYKKYLLDREIEVNYLGKFFPTLFLFCNVLIFSLIYSHLSDIDFSPLQYCLNIIIVSGGLVFILRVLSMFSFSKTLKNNYSLILHYGSWLIFLLLVISMVFNKGISVNEKAVVKMDSFFVVFIGFNLLSFSLLKLATRFKRKGAMWKLRDSNFEKVIYNPLEKVETHLIDVFNIFDFFVNVLMRLVSGMALSGSYFINTKREEGHYSNFFYSFVGIVLSFVFLFFIWGLYFARN